jgi:hypothetical protein
MVHDVAATLAQGQRAANGMIAIDNAVRSLPELKEKLERQIAALVVHKERGVYWFSSVANFFRLLKAFFTGSVSGEKKKIRAQVQDKVKALRRKIGDAGADADAAVIALQNFMHEIEQSLQEYTDFQEEQKSGDQAQGSR